MATKLSDICIEAFRGSTASCVVGIKWESKLESLKKQAQINILCVETGFVEGEKGI